VEGKKASEPLLTPSFLGLGLVEPAFRIKQLLVSATRTAIGGGKLVPAVITVQTPLVELGLLASSRSAASNAFRE
jgi:hypothetical protein